MIFLLIFVYLLSAIVNVCMQHFLHVRAFWLMVSVDFVIGLGTFLIVGGRRAAHRKAGR